MERPGRSAPRIDAMSLRAALEKLCHALGYRKAQDPVDANLGPRDAVYAAVCRDLGWEFFPTEARQPDEAV